MVIYLFQKHPYEVQQQLSHVGLVISWNALRLADGGEIIDS